MDGLLEILPFLAFAIIGIINAIGKGNKQQEKNQPKRNNRPANVPRPTATPSGGNANPRQPVNKPTVTSITIEEQQKQQMERLANRLSANVQDSKSHNGNQDHTLGSAIKDQIKHQSLTKQEIGKERFRKQIKNGLNQQGLVQGIIMSEVLGPPRARKPYRSVIVERRNR